MIEQQQELTALMKRVINAVYFVADISRREWVLLQKQWETLQTCKPTTTNTLKVSV